MGGKQSTNAPRGRTYSNSSQSAGLTVGSPGTSGGMMGARGRAQSLGSVPNGAQGHSLSIPSATSGAHAAGSPDSDSSTPEESAPGLPTRFLHHQSLPLHLFSFQGIKCPVCNKFIPPDDIECHLVMCLTKPRITYNEDVLTEDKGECVICLEDLEQGDTIARLPCLCIYHKNCIDMWFQRNRSCPEHPID